VISHLAKHPNIRLQLLLSDTLSTQFLPCLPP
jgi:hypothetical protein